MTTRRTLLQYAVSIACVSPLFRPRLALADTALDETLKREEYFQQWINTYLNFPTVAHSDAIVINVPEIAENSSVVPVAAQLGMHCGRVLLCLKAAPNPLVADYTGKGMRELATRIRIPVTDEVVILALRESQWLRADATVKVSVACNGGA